MKLVWLAGLVILHLGMTYGGTPYFVNNMHNTQIKEGTPAGTEVYTLLAKDPDGGSISYYLTADFLAVDQFTGVVTLTRSIDYETEETSYYIPIVAETTDGQIVESTPSVQIIDVNDNPALFSADTYSLHLAENQTVGAIISNLTVSDKDYTGSQIKVECNPMADSVPRTDNSYVEACSTFKVNAVSGGNKLWSGNLQLVKPLDYENRTTYQLPLETFDGKNLFLRTFEIIIDDINDTPPIFTYSSSATVNESIPVNSVLTHVTAIDRDTSNPHDIRYDINCTNDNGTINLFEIDPKSGNIMNVGILDRESAILSQGYLELCVKARELIAVNPDKLGNDSKTTATTTIRISVRDTNDNSPSFTKTNHTINIYEDIPNETTLPGLIMTVKDIDSGTANSYSFVLLDNADVFAVDPDRGQGQTTASIKVIDTSKIDYEKGPKQYILRVEAREVLSSGLSQLTGSATVTVNVLDVNDNIPLFTEPNYERTILETANIGYKVVDISVLDPDTGNYGFGGVIYGLVGNGAEKFLINNRTGTVTVANCTNHIPGKNPCIDYEVSRRYALTVTATDNLGRDNSKTASLIINIEDVNDNKPKFLFDKYFESIIEGQTITVNDLLATATDVDTVGSPLRYSIIPTGNSYMYWQIDPVTANITAKKAIKYEDAPDNKGLFDMSVDVTDGSFTTLVTVQISVIDRNDKVPIFSPDQYSEYIDESTGGDVPILIVTATDQDSPTTDNGRIEYGIESGAQGRFVVNRTSGQIFTAHDAAFDFDLEKQYVMVVLARDGGNPQQTGTASVTINIRDSNNKDPYFKPTTHRTDVYENVGIGYSVTTVTANDLDSGAILKYGFIEPISAITPEGLEVNRVDYAFTQLFVIDKGSGKVSTMAKLDRDKTSVLTLTLEVVDTSATPRQTGTGTLIITILEFNDQHPYFLLPFYNLTVDEEQPIGSFINTLIAQDDDDSIALYEIYDDFGNYFDITPTTGVLTVRSNIDYEKITETSFMARATDSGVPPLSNTTRVHVNIRNINDNSPNFLQSSYTASINEHRPNGDFVTTVSAIDHDKGDYGVVKYSLTNAADQFTIGVDSGEITIAADLDREVQSLIVIQVTAYDSPLDATVRREYTVPVYIYLNDINDNYPKFSSNEYEATIIETIDPGAQVLQVLASDRDAGVNALIAFAKIPNSGNGLDYFNINQVSGRITVRQQGLRDREGDYVFYVSAKDLNGDPLALNDTAKVTIHVLQATNSPPIWTIPPRDNLTIEVLESQYLGMLVYDAEAVDEDNGPSGIVDYGFYHQGQYTTNTGAFRINPITGVIRAEMVYDKETLDRYYLVLSARDRGVPSFLEAVRFLTVVVIDVNDNVPEFSTSNGETVPYKWTVAETVPSGTPIGNVTATDKDTIGQIFYKIIAGDTDIFAIKTIYDDVKDKYIGEVSLLKNLDREVQSEYNFDVLATNNISDYSVISRRKRSTNPSIVTVQITVKDVEDEAPVFTSFNGPNNAYEYYGCISSMAPFGKSIVQVFATDADAAGPAGVTFSLTSGNTDNAFDINSITGLIHNRKLLNGVAKRVYLLTAAATDKGDLSATADVKIFVTEPGNSAKIVIKQKSSEVRRFIQQLIRLLQLQRDIQYICVTEVRDHVTGSGTVDNTQTDVYVTGVYGSGKNLNIYSSSQLITTIKQAREDNKNSYDALYITGVGTQEEERGFLDETPILAVLIIIILLIIMALILFCLACYCIRDAKRKKRKKVDNFARLEVSQMPVKEAEPVYDNPGFERDPLPVPVSAPRPVQQTQSSDYAIVQKKRRPSYEMAPMIVAPVLAPEPQSVEPEGPDPVIETIVMDDFEDPEPVIVTEIFDEPEQAVYIPDPEPQAVYIPDQEPQAVYIPDQEPQAVYIPDQEPQAVYIHDQEPSQQAEVPDDFPQFPEEDGNEDMIVEFQDETPRLSPKSSPSPRASPSPRYSPHSSPRLSTIDDPESATGMM